MPRLPSVVWFFLGKPARENPPSRTRSHVASIKMRRLTSSFIFLRKQQSKREAYHLFTTLARDLADRYPSFKTALGRVVKDNTYLRVGARDYDTLFQSLILDPLADLHTVSPLLVVTDALIAHGAA